MWSMQQAINLNAPKGSPLTYEVNRIYNDYLLDENKILTNMVKLEKNSY